MSRCFFATPSLVKLIYKQLTGWLVCPITSGFQAAALASKDGLSAYKRRWSGQSPFPGYAFPLRDNCRSDIA